MVMRRGGGGGVPQLYFKANKGDCAKYCNVLVPKIVGGRRLQKSIICFKLGATGMRSNTMVLKRNLVLEIGFDIPRIKISAQYYGHTKQKLNAMF